MSWISPQTSLPTNDAAIDQMRTAVAIGMVRNRAIEVLDSFVVIPLLRIPLKLNDAIRDLLCHILCSHVRTSC
ncbi:hypothetical protein NY98_24130 [Xanthomonas citri pv. fuscans]|uniref:Uncharacterized protein n=2 Tax=Xanthomonas citri TaxID=346 RepID=A0AB34SPT6_XANCI|nr:hypothetical protein AC613_00515 [Xanthomonas citri pv. fuscans]KKY04222.1 hypothetical protein NY94_24035 [Xanthomonas phaseoli pv. phaseoli]AZU23575.1 hypothetical protein AC612_00515 [Xanthomonas citri pv. fuscans]AZU90885.1 hypothetical protein AC614_00515 [Xanthomonas citri pv. fuscans]KKW48593.1 hypothetical protein NY98_24130 [Xanthomonas citri pv. fuscans]